MEKITRRSFLGMSAVAAGSVAAMAVGCAPAEEEQQPAEEQQQPVESAVEASTLTGWAGTPAEILALGGSTMPLEDLNAYRKAYIDKQTDYTCEDGTVIPAVFVKVRALIHTYGMGCGNTPADFSWGSIMANFSEDDAQAFLDMPWGKPFTAIEMYEKTCRPLEECTEICERLAKAGYLCRFQTTNGTTYHQVPYFQGVVEYHFTDCIEEPETWNMMTIGITGVDTVVDFATTGTPTFYAVPCNKSVVPDSTVLPFDDVESIIKSKNLLAIAPCACRYTAAAWAGVEGLPTFEDFMTGEFEDYMSPVVGEEAGNVARVETCLMLGTEAEYWINQGWAREITQEQALEYMKRSCEDGFIIESCHGKNSETICSCHHTSCNIIANWNAVGDPATIGATPGHKNISHYTLEHDPEKCLKCGICMKRCPVQAISMDGEGGLPVQNEMCFKCGQCAYVCPQTARKLVQRPESEFLELPQGFVEDNNMKAAYRFEMGLIA